MPVDVNKCKELIRCAASGNVLNVKRLLEDASVDVNYVVSRGGLAQYTGTALYQAIDNSHEGVVKILLNHPGLNISALDVFHPFSSSLNAISHAVIKGLDDIVARLLEKGADVNGICAPPLSFSGANALGHAVMRGNLKLARMILETGDVELSNAAGFPILHCATNYASHQMLTLLLENGADPNEVDSKGRSPLTFAMRQFRGHIDDIDLMDLFGGFLRSGARVTFEEYSFFNPAVANFISSNHLPNVIDSLLQPGFDINFKGAFDITPLMVAAESGNLVVVDRMIARGADITAQNQFGGTALTITVRSQAALEEDVQVMESMLLARAGRMAADEFLTAVAINDLEGVRDLVKLRKIDVNNTDAYGRTPLMMCSEDDKLEMVKIILDKNIWLPSAGACKNVNAPAAVMARIDAQDKDGKTALAHACKNASLEVATFLLGKAADINARDHAGNTALATACEDGNFSVADFLLTKKADVNAKNLEDQTPLMLACSHRAGIDVVRLLMAAGADAAAVDSSGRTARHHLDDVADARHGGPGHIDVRAWLEGGQGVGRTPLDVLVDEKSGFLFQEVIANTPSAAQKRTLSKEDNDFPGKKENFNWLHDGDEWVQLAAQSRENAAQDNLKNAGQELSIAERGHEDQLDLILSAGAMDHLQL